LLCCPQGDFVPAGGFQIDCAQGLDGKVSLEIDRKRGRKSLFDPKWWNLPLTPADRGLLRKKAILALRANLHYAMFSVKRS
jgi:hypothetical protein